MPLILFLVSAGGLIYLFAGYPLLLECLARWRPRPVQRAPFEPGVSILLAVRNGERYIERKLGSIFDLQYPRDKVEVIVISDGSTDRTDEIVSERFGGQVRLLRQPGTGKCAALNLGIASARNEILVFTDVRQTLAPDSLSRLMENFADPAVGAASGELEILKGGHAEQAVGLYWRYEVRIRQRLSDLDSIFGASGAYYAMRRELTTPLPVDALADDMHLPLGAFFRGYRLILDSRARMYDEPANLEDEFWRKIRTLAGNYQILRSYPGLLGPSNRMWLHYVSYKFGRLIAPFGLLTVLVTSFGLPPGWRVAALAVQGVFYGLALLDRWLPDGLALKRLSAPARAFVTLMCAAACAVSIFFVSSGHFWRATRIEGKEFRSTQ